MNDLIDGYRDFDISKHPAVLELMKSREEDAATEYVQEGHDEL